MRDINLNETGSRPYPRPYIRKDKPWAKGLGENAKPKPIRDKILPNQLKALY